MRNRQRASLSLYLFLFLAIGITWASIAGSISGLVTDSTGAVIPGATVVATDTQTGVKTTVTTDAKGFYSLPALPVGTYDLQVGQIGFKTYTETGLVINANSALRVDATLSVGTINEKIEVRTDAVHVEAESTQMGEVITGKTMTAVP
ncbi:MAG: carboxypeptidase-like regulatory domain-containing protein, partial [Terriglobales bacterium]